MAKRFTDTNKYKKPFIRGLQGAYKLLWDYLYHDCDHAGIWIVDFEIAQIYIGSDMPINKEDALRYFNKDKSRIVLFDNNKKWFIPSFVNFQYGILNEENRAHKSVILILKKNKGLISSLKGYKDKDKDKDKDKEQMIDFIIFWDLYNHKVGDKGGCEKKWNNLKELERQIIINNLPNWIKQFPDKQFQPYPSTYLNQKRWNDEIESKSDKNNTLRMP